MPCDAVPTLLGILNLPLLALFVSVNSLVLAPAVAGNAHLQAKSLAISHGHEYYNGLVEILTL